MTAPHDDAPVTDTARPTDADGWTRMHPLTPWVKSWTFLALALFVFLQQGAEQWATRTFGVGGDDAAPAPAAEQTPEADPVTLLDLLPALGVIAGVLLLLGVLFLLSWWFTRFRLTGTEIQLRTGWLVRKNRQMRLDRLQAVDLQHPLVPRIFDLAAVKVEAADGAETALELSFLKRRRAEALRREILDHASGVAARPGGVPDAPASTPTEAGAPSSSPEAGQAGAGTPAPVLRDQDEGVHMLTVPTGRLIGSVLLSDVGPVAVALVYALYAAAVGVFIGLAPQTWFEDAETRLGVFQVAVGGIAVPLLFAAVASLWSGLNKGWGFTVRHSRDGLKLRYGLTETNSQTVPPGRVQGVAIQQPLFWRPLGWYQVRVQVAGYGAESGAERSLVLPVGRWEDVLRVLTVVAPDPGVAEGEAAELSPAELMHVALHGQFADGGFTHIPRRARAWFTWFTWRRTGFLTTSRLLLVRGGRFARRLEVAEHERIQDLRLGSGPVQRRLGVADVTVHLAGGKQVTVKAQDRAAAEALFQRESQIAAVARRLKDRDQWMTPEELERFERQLQPTPTKESTE